jgi:hypothetical protein
MASICHVRQALLLHVLLLRLLDLWLLAGTLAGINVIPHARSQPEKEAGAPTLGS